MQECYMLLVDGDVNSNKYYHMKENGDGTFTAEYGRVGRNPQTATYPMSKWNTKHSEKERKGYRDVTHLKAVAVEDEKGKSIDTGNSEIDALILKLQAYATKAIKKNYTIAASQVTPQMINEGQSYLNNMTKAVIKEDLVTFNRLLTQLYVVIPRAMKDVKSTMAKSVTEMQKVLNREQGLLDTLKGQIVTNAKTDTKSKTKTSDKVDTLKALGLSIRAVNANEEKQIKEWLGNMHRGHYKNAWVIRNEESYKKYQALIQATGGNIKQQCLWHGSRNENWWSIITTNLSLKPTNAVITGKMFGYGLYFANNAHKSYGYTSGRGSYWAAGGSNTCFLALYDIAYGNPVYTEDNNGMWDMSWQKLQAKYPGKHCVHAKAGRALKNDEIIIYREEQCTLHYLVELSV